MGYRRMKIEDLKSIFRRWHKSQSITLISRAENRDRKTVRQYVMEFKKAGYKPGCKIPQPAELTAFLKSLLPKTNRKNTVSDILKMHLEEIKALINDPKEPVKTKTAWLILKQKYQIPGSYETFKVFARKQQLKYRGKSCIRIELPPGLETQVDYGKMGLHLDSLSSKNRTVYGFCGLLSCSRLPYIEYVYKQTKESFVESNINMFEFYEGTTEYISIDNLKSGVMKPDLYDPKLNIAYREMAEHYGVFINPCRVAKSTDKGKIERLIPVARELFRRLKTIYPTATLAELNKHAKRWCLEEYGLNEHGTTRIAPVLAFTQEEKAKLKPLPAKRFSVPVWKKAKVHPDQFVSFNKKRYSLPPEYKHKEVWIRKTDGFIEIFYDYKLIRSYTEPFRKSYAYVSSDFPEVIREMMEGGYPAYLLNKARQFGKHAYQLIEYILTPHAYLNARRAQGVLTLMEKYKDLPLFSDVCKKALRKGIKLPKSLRLLFEEEKDQYHFPFIEKCSKMQKEMIRDIHHYFN